MLCLECMIVYYYSKRYASYKSRNGLISTAKFKHVLLILKEQLCMRPARFVGRVGVILPNDSDAAMLLTCDSKIQA